jgi:hypothetical protein
VSHKKQELFIICEHLSSPLVFGGVCVFRLFSFLCCPIMCLYVLGFGCDVHFDFRLKTMFGSSFPPVVCRRAHFVFTLFMFACV